jgi:multiple sugar transport system ATP-binding protein
MSTIELSGLTKQFGALLAVDRADLSVAAGEVVCLLGPSGCGKTTTLRMIAGLEQPTDGEIRIAGRRVNGLSPSQRNVAMVFQFYALYPTLTVRENLAYPLHAGRLSASEIEANVRRVSATLQLDAVLERRPGELAEGEKQRVAVGRAIIRDPNCFLFDEPLSRLDVQLRETMRGQIKEVLAGLNKATVIVTHDQLEALTMADRIAVMRNGLIEQVATPHEIFARPANLFVAGFIGTPQMNIIPAQFLGRADGTMRVRIAQGEMAVESGVGTEQLAPGAKVTLGIRPRSIDIVSEATPATIPAKVDLIEPMGAETLLHLLHGKIDLRAVVDRRSVPALGSTAHLRFRPGHTHLFDETERRVQ